MAESRPMSPSSVTSDDAYNVNACEVLVSLAPSSQEAVAFSQRFRKLLVMSGVQSTMALTDGIGGVAWRRSLVRLLKRTSVYACIITTEWVRSGVEQLALYYALRRSFVCSSPIVVPILMPDVADSDAEIIAKLRGECFHVAVREGDSVESVVAKLRNFLVALKYDIPDATHLSGLRYVDIYTKHYTALLGKAPKAALVQFLGTLTPDTTVLDFSPDLTRVPPLAFYLGDNGLRPLLEVVKQLPNLQRLVLRGNGLTNNVVHSLVLAVLSHPSLTAIDLGENEISQVAAAELCYLLRNNEQITELRVDGTKISSTVWLNRIDTQLRYNKLSRFGEWCKITPERPSALPPRPSAGPPAYADLDPRTALHWDVVVTVTPPATALTAQWDAHEASLRAQVRVLVPDSQPTKSRARQDMLRFDDALGVADFKGFIEYVRRDVDRHTCSIKKMNGATLKLVLENNGAGVEALQQDLRRHVLARAKWPQGAALLTGRQLITLRVACEYPAKGKAASFFVDTELWYDNDVRISKTVPQLFKENIIKYTGSLRHEVLCLIDRIYDDELVLDEEREALIALEDEEDKQLEAQENAEKERVLSYWKVNTNVYKQSIDGDLFRHFKNRREALAAQSRLERTTKEDSLAMKLTSIEDRYIKACFSTPNCPPYCY